MSCKGEGSTHYACECILEQLQAADRVAEALSVSRGQWIHSVNKNQCLQALAAYEKAKEGK